MLKKRLIVCLDVMGGRVVKGVQFTDLRDVGDPAELAMRYEDEGADEIVFLDISASAEGRRTLLDVVQRTAEKLFIPLTVGGGINETEDVARALRAGADKVSVNTAAVKRPELLTEAAELFGSQCVVASIDAKRDPEATGLVDLTVEVDSCYRVYTHGARTPTELRPVSWAKECVAKGAGEILLTSIDQDGARSGYDLELTRQVADAVTVPVIASGGAGSAEHVRDAFLVGGADAALVAGILHDGITTVPELKAFLSSARISVRWSQEGQS